jgi:hypothetical protein
MAGLGYQFAPLPWVRLEGAAGWGPTGAQLSIMSKIALGRGTCAFTAGFGPSLALGGQQVAEWQTPNPNAIPWLNLDLPGIECRSRSGFSATRCARELFFRRGEPASAGGSNRP